MDRPRPGHRIRQTRWWSRSDRAPGQAMVLTALALAILIGFMAVVINAGMLLGERRHLQNAADAAAFAGAERIVEEHDSRSFRDSRVQSGITTIALQNNVDVGGSRQLTATYLDQSGSSLGTVGAGGQFSSTAVAVEVRLSGQLATMLPSFVRQSSIPVQAVSRAGLSSVPYASTVANPVPLGVPLAAFQAGASFDLYDQSIALASYGVSGYRPFLNLVHASNAGTGYQAGTDFGSLSTDEQFWSDGLHSSGQLGTGNTIAIASGSFAAQVQAGLLDNVRRQGLTDSSGNAYAVMDLPLWSQYQTSGGVDTVTIAGFARFKIIQSEITTTTLRGYFVPYLVTNPPSGSAPGVRWGPGKIAFLL